MKISVQVKSSAKNPKVEKVGEVTKVHVKEPAVEGKANKAVAKALAKYYGVKTYEVSLLRGEKSKQKVFQINVKE